MIKIKILSIFVIAFILNFNQITEAKAKGSASNMKATPTATNKQPIVESDEMVSRFKKLAGII